MRSILLILTLLTFPCLAQKPANVTGSATTKGECSPAVTGSNNNFKFSCGVGRQQGDQIIALLNKLLAANDTSEVITKLNEILKRTNPNLPVMTYDCSGRWQSIGPDLNSDINVNGGGNSSDFDEMMSLYNQRLINQLVVKCEGLLQSEPGWLSPRLFCSLAYLGLGNIAKAKEHLDAYDSQVGPAYLDDQHCSRISTALHSKLDQQR